MLQQGACALVLSPAFPLAYVAILQTLSIPLLNFSRIPQVSPAAGASVVLTLTAHKTNNSFL
jgi:ethanolamine transporter EutH